ncbi:MAG: hypothetical protein LQ339_002429 [Xanthoria mediterranea]|nr:MAG: hypothetical protein LQ339_002429 [Xanthoria mediterranea]
MRFLPVVALIFGLHRGTAAVAWLEPAPTPQAHLLQAGVSPRPTDPPGLNGIPKELVRRQQDLIYPPPQGWCGFVGGDYDDPLTCKSTYACVTSGYGLGCCPGPSSCTNIFTTCKDFDEVCDGICEGNEKVLKCSESSYRYCGTYRFSGATRMYNCDSTSRRALSVQFVEDHYATAITGSLASSENSFTKESTTSPSARATSPPSSTYDSPDTERSDSGDGLSAGAIRGIAIGISVGACVIFILLAIFIVKRRRANRMKRATQPNLPPAYSPSAPMQQQPLSSSNPAYQAVPQHDQSHPATHGGYFTPDTVGKNNGTSVITQQPSLSPPPSQTPQQRHSAAPSSFLSPNTSEQGRDSFYKPNGPISPVTEVNGSGRPLPEADSIARPMSTHQGMVSPTVTGNPASPNLPPQYGQPQPSQGQVHGGYVPPRVGSHEAPPNQANAGPYEMPDQRH